MNDLYVMGEVCKPFYPILAMIKACLTHRAKIIIFCFMLLAVPVVAVPFNNQASSAIGNPAGFNVDTLTIQPLQIGDTIPEALWNLPLQMVKAGQEGSTTVTLNEYKGKFIILDFWATWCGPCVASLPHLYDLKEQFPALEVLPVALHKAEEIKQFAEKSQKEIFKNPNFNSVLVENPLRNYFPFRSVPHTVVINRSGQVESITTPPYLDASNVEVMLSSGKSIYIATKREFSLQEPILKHAYDDVQTQPPLYYSAVTGFTDGFDGHVEFAVDTTNNVTRFYAKNKTVLQLYISALEKIGFNATMPSRRILVVRRPVEIHNYYEDDGKRSNTELNWKRKTQYTYEALLPSSFDRATIRKRMKNDLNDFFGMITSIERHNMPCLIIKALDDTRPYASDNQQLKDTLVLQGKLSDDSQSSLGRSAHGAYNYVRNYRMKNLAFLLNKQRGEPLPWVINESGYDGKVDLDLPDNLDDKAALRKSFREQGLDIVLENRNLDMFVMYENGVKKEGTLKLSRYGYTYQ